MKASSQLGLMLVFIIIMACGQGNNKSAIDVEAEREAVMVVFKGLLVMSESGNVEGYMNHLSEEAVMMYSGQPAVMGTAKIRPFITDFFENFEFQFNPWQSDEIQVLDDWAFHRYSGIATITPKSGGESIKLDRKYIDILRKETGSWKVTHHIFNTNN
ncbi:YybH family protein [Candidatus Latescibacterota bacterium]